MNSRIKSIPWRRAILEVATIVFSILFALMLNEWRQGVSDRSMQSEYLARLSSDLQENVKTAQNYQDRHRNQVARARTVFDFVVNAERSDMSNLQLVQELYWASPSPTPTWASDTYRELNSTGRLALISDPELRKSIMEYFRFLESNDWAYQFLSVEYRDQVRSEIHSDLQLLFRSSDSHPDDFLPYQSDINELVKWMNGNNELRQGLNRVIMQWSRAEDEFLPTVMEVSRQLNELVEFNLNELQ